MKDRKIVLWIILLYIILMLIGTEISNYILKITDSNLAQLIGLTTGQIIATLGVNYIIKKFYKWEDIGFDKINKKGLIYFAPYVVIMIFMGSYFIFGIYKNFSNINATMWFMMILNLIGTVFAGFSEEVIFRGVLLNDIKKYKSIVLAMVLSSIGFSVIHITTVFSGLSIIQAIYRVLYTSLLGFSFVSLAIKINNLLPLIIFHIVWNYILIVSAQIGVEVSKASLFFNPINIVVGVILWIIIIVGEIKKKKLKVN